MVKYLTLGILLLQLPWTGSLFMYVVLPSTPRVSAGPETESVFSVFRGHLHEASRRSLSSSALDDDATDDESTGGRTASSSTKKSKKPPSPFGFGTAAGDDDKTSTAEASATDNTASSDDTVASETDNETDEDLSKSNVTTPLLPPEQEQPEAFRVMVVILFAFLASVLCTLTAVRRCRTGKRSDYEEIQNLVV